MAKDKDTKQKTHIKGARKKRAKTEQKKNAKGR